MTYWIFGNDYRVALLSEKCQTTKWVILEKFEIDSTTLTCLNHRKEQLLRKYGVTVEQIDPIYRKVSLLEILCQIKERSKQKYAH